MHIRVGILTLLGLILFSCAVITVNIYFPEKEVKSALKSLEEEFLKEPTPQEEQKAPEEKPKPQPEGRFGPSPIMIAGPITLLVQPAWAQRFDAAQISREIKSFPEVVQAYKNRGTRVGRINGLKDRGLVGEGMQGTLVPRGQLSQDDPDLLAAEDGDRQVIIRGLAKAIAKINDMPLTEANITQFLPKARGVFAETQREEAKPGWWVQLPDGSWVKKK